MRELDVAKGAAVAAGKKIMELYQKESAVHYKGDCSPVTAADQAANDIITQMLGEDFPEHAILSEESQDDGRRLENDGCWIVDPLDGTKEFIHGNGEFTVNIALAFRHRVVLGVIYVPVSKELYYAVQGEGAYVEKDGQVEKLQVSARRENLRLVMSRSHPSERLDELIRKNQISEVKRAGSSLKCSVRNWDRGNFILIASSPQKGSVPPWNLSKTVAIWARGSNWQIVLKQGLNSKKIVVHFAAIHRIPESR